MTKRYEWSLIPYPYFRAFTLFNAFVLSAITIGIITGVSIELRDFFVNYKERRDYYHGFNEDITASSDTITNLYNPGEHIKMEKINIFETDNYNQLVPRAIRATIVSCFLSFIVYLMMYFIFGFGGSMTSPRRRWRLFSSIRGNKSGKIFV